MAQDEWGHARLLYAMLKDYGEDPVSIEHDRAPEAYANAPALDAEFADWAEVVAAIAVVDGALTARLQGFQQGRYETARSRLAKMLGEEEFHRDMGLAWMRKLANSEGRGRVKAAVEAMLPSTLAWMAPGDDADALLTDAGILDGSDATFGRFREVYGEAIEAPSCAVTANKALKLEVSTSDRAAMRNAYKIVDAVYRRIHDGKFLRFRFS